MRWLFLPIASGKPWNGLTIHTEPLGGSEAAVAYTARALWGKGEQVTVMTHGTEKESWYEGVRYMPQAAFGQLFEEDWDVVVSSRWIDVLNQVPWPNTVTRFLWVHDMPHVQGLTVNCHRMVCVSEYQRRAWSLQDEFSAVIGNGVDMTIFDQIRGKYPRHLEKVVWTSNPDRGLPMAAKIFQEVRKRWPDLELHVYGRSAVYGWGQEAEEPFLPRPEHMENVVLHKPLARHALAKELADAWAWFYPTYWPETYCIAALEAQAAGLPIIASPFGALNETVRGGVLSYDFLNAFSQLRNVRRWSKLSEAGLEWARENTWNLRAKQWIDLAQEVKNGRN